MMDPFRLELEKKIETNRIAGGLGQLTDGQVGDDNIDADVSRHGKGYEWVGWSRQASSSLTAPAGKPPPTPDSN